MQAERVHDERPQPGPPGADHVDGGHVADVPHGLRGDGHDVERGLEDAGVGLHDPDVAGVDDALDLDADAGPDLEDLALPQPLGHEPVGVRHDAEPHAGLGERAQALAAAVDDAHPQRGVGELAVEVAVDLLAVRARERRSAIDVRGQVLVPAAGPVGLDVEIDVERDGRRVVGPVQEVGRRGAAEPAPTRRGCAWSGSRNTTARVEEDGLGPTVRIGDAGHGSAVDLAAGLDELGRLLLQAELDGGVLGDAVGRGVVAHVLA